MAYTANDFVNNALALYDKALATTWWFAQVRRQRRRRSRCSRCGPATDRAHTRANICQSQVGRQTVTSAIAVVAPHYPPHVGGAEAYADRLVKRYQADDNLRPIVVTTKPRGLRTTLRSQDGVQIVELSTWWSLSNTPLDPMRPLTLSRIYSKFDVDVVHAHAPVPVLADIAVPIAGSRPTLLTYHCGSMVGSPGRRIWLFGSTNVTYCPALSNVLTRCWPFLRRRSARTPNAEVLAPGVDTELFHPPAQRRDVSRTILYVGRIDRSSAWKGIEELIRAFAITHANAPDARLRIVGDGDATPELRALCRALDVPTMLNSAAA